MREKSIYMTELFMKCVWEEYAKTLKLKKTRSNYFYNICSLCDFAKADFPQIDEEMALAYFDMCRHADSRPTNKTMHTWLSCYRSIGRYIMGHCRNLPQMSEYKSPFETIYLTDYSDDIQASELPSEAELEKIMETAAGWSDNGQMYLILLFATKCAMTPGEIRSLTPEKIKVDAAGRGFVVFKDKKRIHDRIVKVPSVIMDYLCDHEDIFEQRETLFLNEKGKPLSERSLQNYIRKLMENAGMDKMYTLQDIRNLSIAKMLFYGATEEETAEYVGIEQRWMYRYSRILPELDCAPCDRM